MGKLSKSRGKSYEYRVAKWFQARAGWEGSFRIPLSGASQRIVDEIAGHDVLAQNDKLEVKIACECKKTGAASMRIEHEWLEKLDFATHDLDKVLIFAFARSDHYIMIPSEQYCRLTGRVAIHGESFSARGKRFFTLHQAALEEALGKVAEAGKGGVSLYWTPHDENYSFMTLADYIAAREKASCQQSES